MTRNEQTALLNPNIVPPAKVSDPPGPVPPSNSYFGLESFKEDIKNIQNGTLPISVLIATTIGCVCGVSCFAYYKVLKAGFKLFWETLPNKVYAPNVDESLHWTWIPLVIMTLSVGVGVSIQIMGDPGDLKYTIKCVHEKAFIPVSHAPSMVVASLSSIVGAGSLGPEAPLVAICASVGGWVSRSLFKQRYKNIVRMHTLCGMACATAAFFGVPLGGALFALEVNNRMGYEYFEHALVSIFSGTVCLVVFRSLAGLEIGPVWKLTQSARDASGGKSVGHMLSLIRSAAHDVAHDSAHGAASSAPYHNVTEIVTTDLADPPNLVAEIVASSSSEVAIGALLGLLGALIAYGWVKGHKMLTAYVNSFEELEGPIPRAVVGGLGITAIGMLIPHTLFWGEFELETITVAGDSVKTLPHLWPHGGASNFEITGFFSALLVGIAKLIAISVTCVAGYRGGFIFPFFCAGAGFGRALTYILPSIHPVVLVLSVGAGINVTITRTALATPLILSALAGEPNSAPPILAASLTAAFVTAYLPFISTQRGRDNIFEAQLHTYSSKAYPDDYDEDMDESDEYEFEALHS